MVMTCYNVSEFVKLCSPLDVCMHVQEENINPYVGLLSDLLLGWNIRETKRTVGGLLG